MNKENNEQDFIVTTTNGTRWGTTAASFAQVRREFFGKHLGQGMEIEKIERGKHDIKTGSIVSHDDAKEQLGKWLK